VNDVLEQAKHILRTADILFDYGRYTGLGEHEADSAVAALARAGVLRGLPAPEAQPLTADRAELLYLRARDKGTAGHLIHIAQAGTARIHWSSVTRGFEVETHRGTQTFSGDLDAAVVAFNRELGDTRIEVL
jgi:hypothetical protein